MISTVHIDALRWRDARKDARIAGSTPRAVEHLWAEQQARSE
jgi:hypothetical protein